MVASVWAAHKVTGCGQVHGGGETDLLPSSPSGPLSHWDGSCRLSLKAACLLPVDASPVFLPLCRALLILRARLTS